MRLRPVLSYGHIVQLRSASQQDSCMNLQSLWCTRHIHIHITYLCFNHLIRKGLESLLLLWQTIWSVRFDMTSWQLTLLLNTKDGQKNFITTHGGSWCIYVRMICVPGIPSPLPMQHIYPICCGHNTYGYNRGRHNRPRLERHDPRGLLTFAMLTSESLGWRKNSLANLLIKR